jgi:hypothetical protein
MARWKFYAHSDGTCCCGGGPCIVYADDFGRADGTDSGDDWEEFPDDDAASLSSGQLVIAGSGDKALFVPSTRKSALVASVWMKDLVEGAVRLFFFDWWSSTCYRFVRFIAHESPAYDYCVIEVGHVSGGGEVVDASIGAGTELCPPDEYSIAAHDDRQLHVCFDGEHAWISGAGDPLIADLPSLGCGTPGAGLPRVGLGNDADIPAKFDDFSYSEHFVDNPLCPECPPPGSCCGLDPALDLLATLSSGDQYGGSCPEATGEFTLRWCPSSDNWIGVGTWGGTTITLYLHCEAYYPGWDPSVGVFMRMVIPGCVDASGLTVTTQYSTCDPFVLVFEFRIPACCSSGEAAWTITITLAP